MPNYYIKVKDLTKRFGNFTAVDNISFNVRKGEILGFLGPNGSGKTTTIRLLCGLLLPTKGEITIANYDVRKDAEKIKSIIGYMSQKFSLYTDLTVYENIQFYAGIYKVKNIKEKIDETVNLLGVSQYRDTLASDLPAGIRQRVALAAAFIHSPSILFLDEPTAGVDPILRRKFWEIIKNLARQGTTILVTTHYMDEAENCDRVALMNQGVIIDIGEIDEIKRKFKKENILYLELSDNYVQNFNLLKEIDLPAQARPAPARYRDRLITDISLHGSVVHIIQKGDIEEAKEEVKKYCKIKGIKYKSIFEDSLSLEDVFINLIKKENA